MQRATIVTTPSNELGPSVQGSAPFLIVLESVNQFLRLSIMNFRFYNSSGCISSSSNSSGGGSPDKKQQRPQRAQAITGAHHFANPQNVRRPHFQSEGKYSCTSNKNPRVGTGNNAGCLDGPNSPTICPESKEGLPSYPPFTDVGFFDGARLLIAKISHHSDRTGKQHQVSQLLEFVYHLPWKSRLRF